MSEFLTLSLYSFKASLRNGGEIFWNVLFLILLFFVFTSVSFEGTPPKVYMNGIRWSDDFEAVDDPEKADAVVSLENGTLRVVYRNPDSLVRLKVNGLVWKLKEFLERGGRKGAVEVEVVRVGERIDYSAFITSGIITMLLFSTGLFGSLKVLSLYRYSGVLKVFHSTPARKWIVYTALSSSSLIQAILGVSTLLFLSRVKGIGFEIEPLGFTAAFLISFSISFGLGVVLASSFKTPRSAMGFGAALYTLMPFFSGVYFPVEFLPESIRWVSKIMPMRYMVELVRKALM